MEQNITVRAIIKDQGKVLLLRRASGTHQYIGQLELPGGKVSFGEDPETAIRREVLEETSAEPQTIQLYRTVSFVDGQIQHIIIVYFVAFAERPKITLSIEHDRFIWTELSGIHLNELNKLSAVVLRDEVMVQLTGADEHAEGRSVVDMSSEAALILYTDGGSRGNPGPSASGYVLLNSQGEVVSKGGKYLGITTNSQAEYQAVQQGLQRAHELGARTLEVRLDSQLVANQLNGHYIIKNRELWPIHASIKDLVRQFRQVTFTHIHREYNTDADAMVNKILDNR